MTIVMPSADTMPFTNKAGLDAIGRASHDRPDTSHDPEVACALGISTLETSPDPTSLGSAPSDVLVALLSEVTGVTVLTVRGKVDAASLASLGAHLQDVSDEGRPFVIDCTDCHFHSTDELSILTVLAARARRRGLSWALAADHRTQRLLELTGVNATIDVFSSSSDAATFVSASATERTSA